MSLLRSVIVLAGLAPACPTPVDAPEAIEAEPRAPTERPALGPVATVERAATVHMPAHFADLLEVHSALIRGVVPDARAAAADIVAERPSVMLESWAPYLYATRDAAREVTVAADLATASAAAATLARTCGECHTAQAARLMRTGSAPPPAEDSDDAARMRRHKWAFDRLWEALVLPSDAAWQEGVAAFVELPACHDDLSGEQDREAIRRARETVMSHAEAARSAKSPEARAQVYGALLPTCASCHAGGC